MILKIVCVYLIIGAIFAFICSVRWNTESDGIFNIVVAIMSVRWHMSKKLCNVIIRACIFVRIGIRWLPSLIKATITVLKRRRNQRQTERQTTQEYVSRLHNKEMRK